MKKRITKNMLTNVGFVLLLGLMIYTPTRVWLLRQIAFSPSVEKAENSEKIGNYTWKLKGLNTNDLDLYMVKDQVVIVNFWATWCPPCRAEMPMFQALYDDYKDKVNFLFVTNEDWAIVQKYFEKGGYDLPAYNSKNNPPELFTKTNSIPASYLIDKNGHVLISETGAADWNSPKIKRLLNKLISE